MLLPLAFVAMALAQAKADASSWVGVTVCRRAVETSDGKLFLAKHNAYQVAIENLAPLRIPGQVEVLGPGKHEFQCDTEQELHKIVPDGDWTTSGTAQIVHPFALAASVFPEYLKVQDTGPLQNFDGTPLKVSVDGVADGATITVTAVSVDDPLYFTSLLGRGIRAGFQRSYTVIDGLIEGVSQMDDLGNISYDAGVVAATNPLEITGLHLPGGKKYVLVLSHSRTTRAHGIRLVLSTETDTPLSTRPGDHQDNLVFNGDFTKGNLGFNSDLAAHADEQDVLLGGPWYTIAPGNKSPYDVNVHTGDLVGNLVSHNNLVDPRIASSYMIFHTESKDFVLWEETVPVQPDRHYVFTAWTALLCQPERATQVQLFRQRRPVGNLIRSLDAMGAD